jgi:starch phosphorylase
MYSQYGQSFTIEVRPNLPERLSRLTDLANDLYYSWDSQVRRIFYRLDAKLWEECGHTPKVFIRQVSQEKLERACQDRIFMQDYNRILSTYDTYLQEQDTSAFASYLDPQSDLVAYFCAEFGLHESFPIYSGGLGILAGDHCKAASDICIPFVAVGLLYRRGYFNQTIDKRGNQIASYNAINFSDLPVEPVMLEGKELHINVDFPGRTVTLKVWQAKAGHITIYLLDSDIKANSEHDRTITYQLYGGDVNTRIQQEIVLGIGGVRLLRTLGIKPSVWHINEGHAAFLILERCREYVQNMSATFESALEVVAAGTVYTTHTPVPAGHDIFNHELLEEYFRDYVPQLDLTWEQFTSLGDFPGDKFGFNQTALALRGSRHHNGVSRIHGGVASQMESYVWPQVPPEENPISYVTNGVHLPTFLSNQWINLFDMEFGSEWRNHLLDVKFWKNIDNIPAHSFWSIKQTLKSELIESVYQIMLNRHTREGCGPLRTERLTRYIANKNTDVLLVGFARRFATYKRATLLFSDLERLERIVSIKDKPIIFLFAGKAHPSDVPGQDLIRQIHDISQMPQFEGKIFLLEGYDMHLARKLVAGVDVWLNNPEYPMEASGTSGEKAGINGVLNLSVADGWWGEGYNGNNGWAIMPHSEGTDPGLRDYEESQELLDILEYKVIPTFYRRNLHGYSEEWVNKSKSSMSSLIPRYNSQRMVMDYVTQFYSKANIHHKKMLLNNMEPARQLAQWKNKIHDVWQHVQIRLEEQPKMHLYSGETLSIKVAVYLGELKAEDVVVEFLLGLQETDDTCDKGNCIYPVSQQFQPVKQNNKGETIYQLEMDSTLTGLQHYKIRIFPYHNLLAHRFEMGYMLWV